LNRCLCSSRDRAQHRIWERIYNPKFNYGEFAIIKSQAGLNNYRVSVKEWVEKTEAVGLKATAGRYGGTYAHKDIAFEFGMWISAEFKIYLIKEFQRLKDQERKQLVCLSNLESLNAHFIQEKMSQAERLNKLNQIAIQQMKLLTDDTRIKRLGVGDD